MERHLGEDHGLPRIESAYASRMGRGGAGSGHRILCAEMPHQIWQCNYHIGRLPDAEKEAVHAWYVFRLKPDNTVWKNSEKADMMHISYGSFKVRVHRARSRIARAMEEETWV